MGYMRQFFDLSTPAKRFRFVAVLEAITWAALLVAMFFKWVLGYTEAVAVPGMVHGIVFVVFVLISIVTAVSLRWSLSVTALALISSIPPFGTLVFEWWARRNGHLAELSGQVDAESTPPQYAA
ncbi:MULTISPECIES: DUF3817 domain-containing protein [Gordonia]|uniref:DUF3817 domain-containing protein n=1 Tax=Gordonia TaxID=2053 RepID=UPI0007EA6618|nr:MULTISPECIES: DUF3817 domain-containing protein [Gordonia]MCM3897607.1 DUF3817 domain-containing protein [Gordonia sputi]OBA60634.1 hypothetical protein A5777_04340 [Gordonia sp. 852002-10350_SCH5691597]